MSNKLMIFQVKTITLNDSEIVNLAELQFDLKQFKVPQRFVVLKLDIAPRMKRAQNHVEERVETGIVTLNFKVYDRAFVELVLNNGGTELGSLITIVVEHQEEFPILDAYEEVELIPIRFTDLKVQPRKIQKKSFIGEGQPMIDYTGIAYQQSLPLLPCLFYRKEGVKNVKSIYPGETFPQEYSPEYFFSKTFFTLITY